MEIDPTDKEYVYAITYEKEENIVMAYTAQWCPSCCRVKVNFPEIFKDYKIIKEEYISKPVFKKSINNLIPYFTKNDKGIQTSKAEELIEFIKD